MELIRKRTIKIENMTCAGCGVTITDELSKLDGVISVKADYKKGIVNVEYDLMHIELKDIESKLNDMDYSVNKRFLYRLRDGFVHFTEENERNNQTTKPASCCSNPTDILEKAGKKPVKQL